MDLEARLRAFKEQTTRETAPIQAASAVNSTPPLPVEEKKEEEATEKETIPVWRDTKEESKDKSARHYIDGGSIELCDSTPSIPMPMTLPETKQPQKESSVDSSNFPTSPNSSLTYERVFRLVQQAVNAEEAHNVKNAIALYIEAGNLLVEVGKKETDTVVQKGMKEKAYELLQRAEQLDEWIKEAQRQAKLALLPPQQRIQSTEVASVASQWKQPPPWAESPEFTHMRYTAVTASTPARFTEEGYRLRCASHRIRVLITVTMYNEEGSEVKATLTGIAKNLAYMSKENPRVWEEYAVVIVSDGRLKASASCLEYLASIGSFNEEIMSITSLGVQHMQVHMFESSPQLVENMSSNACYPPLQLIYALKEHNGGKLDSHLWFFNAFAEHLLPMYTVLVDVGTIPGKTSLYRLIRSMDRNPQIGGVAGEIAVEKPNFFKPVIAAQHFEYKISNIMDKSLESIFGFISVLPGAFSAYRYEAIRANENGKGPLPEYFRSLTTSIKELGPFKGNMYLAEDRILCFELLSRDNCRWTMHYVKNAIACTDVPETLVDLIKQRRRWLNGSFFAGLFSIMNFGRVWADTSHSLIRKLVLSVQFFYLIFQTLIGFFLLSNLFLTFYYVLVVALQEKYDIPLRIILLVYSILVGGVVIFSLGNKPERRTGYFYTFACIFYGLVMYFVVFISAGALTNTDLSDDRFNFSCPVSQGEVQIGTLGALGLIFLSAFIHGEFSVLASTLQYFFLLPTFVNVIGIFAYSNLHDLSWGTKGLETGSGHAEKKGNGLQTKTIKDMLAEKKKEEIRRQKEMQEKEEVDNSFRTYRSSLLLLWLAVNGAWIYGMTRYIPASCYLKYLSYLVVVFNTIRFIGSFIYLFFRIARRLGLGCRKSSAKSGDNYTANLPLEWQQHYAKNNICTPSGEDQDYHGV